jgi:hypothetical protein
MAIYVPLSSTKLGPSQRGMKWHVFPQPPATFHPHEDPEWPVSYQGRGHVGHPWGCTANEQGNSEAGAGPEVQLGGLGERCVPAVRAT